MQKTAKISNVGVIEDESTSNLELKRSENRIADLERMLSEKDAQLVKLAQSEEAVSKAHDQLLEAIEVLPDGLVIYDSDRRLFICNSKYRELYPLVADTMMPGVRFDDIIQVAAERGQHIDAQGRIEEWINERMATFRNPGPSQERQFPDGSWLLVYDRKTADGGTIGVRIDITELKERERALEESQTRLRDYVDASTDYFWEMDENLQFSYFSERFTEVTGVDAKTLLGKTREETSVPNVDPRQWKYHLDALQNRRPFRNFVHPRTMPDGKVVWLSVNGVPYFDEARNFKGFRGTGTDVTEQIEAEAEVIKSREEAVLANRAKSEFLANMSHELRTPLNCILGFSEVLKNELFGPIGSSKNLEYANAINESGNHLHKIIGDILDISKIEAGKENVEDSDIDVGAVVRDCVSMVEVRALDQEIRVQINVPDDLPMLRADERHVKQVVLNLLSNAIKFTSGDAQIGVGAKLNDESRVEISVTDTGIGIEGDDIPKILKPFGQVARSYIRDHGGMGLGLPICNSLMVLHGGKLEIESEVGKGTTVTAKFPRERTIRS